MVMYSNRLILGKLTLEFGFLLLNRSAYVLDKAADTLNREAGMHIINHFALFSGFTS